MPCYQGPPSKEEIRRYVDNAIADGDFQKALRMQDGAFETLLCDAMTFLTPAQIEQMHPYAIGWWAQHKYNESQKSV